MRIFGKKNKKPDKGTKMLGAYIPVEMHVYFTLRAMVGNTSISEVFQTLLAKEMENLPLPQIISTVTTHIYDVILENSESLSVAEANAKREEIIKQALEELSSKGIPEDIITQIQKEL